MLSEQEFASFRQDIIKNMSFEVDPVCYIMDKLNLNEKIKELARKDHATFLDLCQKLLQDEKQEVRQGTLLLLSIGIPRDADVAQLLVECSLNEEDLLDNALYALAHVATHAFFSTLYHYASKGSTWALHGVGRLAQTGEEVQLIIQAAHKYLLSPDFRLRHAALTILTRRSKIEIEEDLILEAVRLYKDENFISALRKATPSKMLPKLRDLATTVSVNSTAFEDLSKTIAILERRMQSEH